MTILEVINKTTPYLQKQGVESPRLTIELLLAHVLQKKRLQLYLEFERELDAAMLDRLREMVKRRVAGEPLQYVTGEVEFCGLKLVVDKRVLIPRPETELLVEIVAARQPATVVDIGTGSGCIALALAKKLPAVQITGIDLCPAALEVAQVNAQRHDLEKFVRFLQGDLLSSLPDSFTCDAIVSNPPYIASGELAKLPREVKDFEPVSALMAGEDGLEVIHRLVMTAKRFLSPNGFVALEIGAGQREAVAAMLVGADFTVAQVAKDLQGHERVIVAVPN
ncbi:MAG: Release factor glutamine methyltransferase [Verrucomicrobiae bacterium]|nr:Release factor glutamine methyltransferase [Verrucomicrobiae bacterium]